ncbi:MAG: gamma-glutamyl-gamma-aminobutyrate hydrolase family protein [Thermoanaerobaculia bacterium]
MPNIVVAYIKEEKVAPYLEALEEVGIPESDVFRATPMRTQGLDLREWMSRADGLLITGGADLQPALYGEARNPAAHLNPPAADRDQMEWDLLVLAREHRIPVFGICRGHQMLNVFHGGSLYQDIRLATGIEGHNCAADDGWALDHLAHELVPASTRHPLAAWLARDLRPLTNSRHHQAVQRIGTGLELVATAPDGIIEATASPAKSDWWRRSVQWHPENLMNREVHHGLFDQFAAETRYFHSARGRKADAAGIAVHA